MCRLKTERRKGKTLAQTDSDVSKEIPADGAARASLAGGHEISESVKDVNAYTRASFQGKGARGVLAAWPFN